MGEASSSKLKGTFPPRAGLRGKLARSTTFLLALTGLITLLTVGLVGLSLADKTDRALEESLRQALIARGESLLAGHAIVLESFVRDAAITDMRGTIADAVAMEDVVYGLFTDSQGRAWAFCSPSHPCLGEASPQMASSRNPDLLAELGLGALAGGHQRETRELLAYGQPTMEFSQPIVVDGAVVGTLRYGISTQSLIAALASSRARQTKVLASSLLTLAIVLGGALVASIVLVRKMAQRITRPLAELTQASARLAAGDHLAKVSISSGDELEILGNAFNQMVTDLSASYDELEERNLALKREIQGRKQAQAERSEMAGHLIQAQKMEAFGQLAGGIAHDFNNILSVVMGNSGLAKTLLDEGDIADLRDLNDEILEAGKRGVNLTRQLLTFARREADTPQLVDPNAALYGFEKMIRRVLEEKFQLIVTTTSPLPRVLIDPGRLEQVLMNLCVNARDSMSQGGKIRLSTSVHVLTGPRVFPTGSLAPGNYVTIEARDEGTGIPDEVRERIFEPFFTTKPSGKGTGLGLATVLNIVRDAGGAIDLETEPGVGASFCVLLPAQAPEKEEVEPTAPAAPRGRGERILLCEDDRSVRAMTERLLKRGGFEVTTVSGGHDALSKLGRRSYDLLISDAIMPEMDGGELAQQVRKLAPTLPILFISGYTGGVLSTSGVREDGHDFLRKPFTAQELLERVLELLGSSAHSPSASDPT